MKYVPSIVPANENAALRDFLQREFQRVANAMNLGAPPFRTPAISWHEQVVTEDTAVPDNRNAGSFGPTVTVADGVSVTVGENSYWSIF
jgi:hypothetical protein